MNSPKFEVAVLLVSWNGKKHLQQCLKHLTQQSDPGCPWHIWVFDNGSNDGTQAWLRSNHPKVRLISNHRNLGFAEAVNRLVAEVNAPAIVLLNNDTAPKLDWLARLVGALRHAPEDVAGIGGMALNWDGSHVDFAGGAMTFDGHAFQCGSGEANGGFVVPEAGSPLLFANGANAIFWREAFLEAGGFDREFFAYYEDVDLGWRLWSQGKRLLFEPGAVIHHRVQATSHRLGMFNRGLLYERNAFLNAYKNLDEPHWQALMPAILMTFMHRTQTLLETRNPGGQILQEIPFLPDSPPAKGLTKCRRAMEAFLRESQWPGAGTLRKVTASIRSRLPFFLAEAHLNDPWTISQFRAVHSVFDLLDLYADRRAVVQARRKRPDRDIFQVFPLHILPTYPGDEAFFQSQGFQKSLPPDLSLVRH